MGVRGVLDNSTSPDQLLNAIEKVSEGQVWLDRTTTARVFVELSRRKNRELDDPVVKAVSSLTERERMLVATVAQNSDVPRKVLADMLSISDSTLRNHLSVIYSKLGVSSRGSGNVDDRTGHVSDFEIVTVDVVAQPSAPNAYPIAIYEGLMNMKYGHKALEIAKEVGQDNKVQRYLKEEIKRLIKDLKI